VSASSNAERRFAIRAPCLLCWIRYVQVVSGMRKVTVDGDGHVAVAVVAVAAIDEHQEHLVAELPNIQSFVGKVRFITCDCGGCFGRAVSVLIASLAIAAFDHLSCLLFARIAIETRTVPIDFRVCTHCNALL
jgi:hypothetical protein